MSFIHLIKSSASILLVRLAGAGMAFVAVVTYARLLGAEGFGVYSVAFTLTSISAVIARWGMDHVALKKVSIAQLKTGFVSMDYINKVMFLIVIVGLFLSGFLYQVSEMLANIFFRKPHLEDVIRLFSFGIVPASAAYVGGEVLKAIGRPKFGVAIQSILPPGISLLLIVVFWSISRSIEVIISSVVCGYVFSLVIFLVCIKRKRIDFVGQGENGSFASLIKAGWPMVLIACGGLVLSWSDIIVISIFGTDEDVGLYMAASRIALLVNFLLIAINSYTAPKYAQLYSENKIDDIRQLAVGSSKLLFFSAILPLLIILTYSEQVMSVYGSSFAGGSVLMTILCVGQFISVVTGSVGYLLKMTGHEMHLRNIMIYTAFGNIVLSVCLIHIIGVVGVALSTALSISIWNIWAMWKVRRHLGFWTVCWKLSLATKNR